MLRALFVGVVLIVSGVSLAQELPASRPATKPAEPPPITKPEELLAGLPAEARPVKGKWDEFSRPKANRWLAENSVGKSYDLSIPITFVHVSDEPQKQSDGTLAWNITARFNIEREFKFGGGSVLFIYDHNARQLNFWTSEDGARAAKKMKPGDTVQVRGKVESASISENTKAISTLTVQSKSVQILRVGTWHAPKS